MQRHHSDHSPISFIKHLTLLSRRSIDYSVLSVGAFSGRALATVVTWCILAFLLFHLFLFLNIALGFALATWSESSPALGFLYLGGGYAVLVLLFLLVRPLLSRRIRSSVARETLRQTMALNHKIDSLPYVNRVPYRTFAKEPDREPANITLQYAQNETMIDIDRVARETVRDSIYIRNYYPSLIAEQLRKETIGYITDLPLIGKVLQFLGSKDPTSKAKHRHAQRRGHAGRGGAHQSEEGYKKYLPYVRIAWDFLRPTLVALAIGKVQDGILGLFLGKKSWKK